MIDVDVIRQAVLMMMAGPFLAIWIAAVLIAVYRLWIAS